MTEQALRDNGSHQDSEEMEVLHAGKGQKLAARIAREGFYASYTFDPDKSRRGIGTLAILWQIEQARRGGQQWTYLGYWSSGHDKMDYKRRFRPIEGFRNNRWQRIEPR